MTDLTLHGGKLTAFFKTLGVDPIRRLDWSYRHPDVPVYFLARAIADYVWYIETPVAPDFLNEEAQGLLDRYDRAKRKAEMAPADREIVRKAEQHPAIQKVLGRREKVAAVSKGIENILRPYAEYHIRTGGGAGLDFSPCG